MKKLKQIAEWLSNFNITLYQVGGSIRDEIMGLPVEDIDICLVGGTTAMRVHGMFEILASENCSPEIKIDCFTSVHGDFPIWIIEIDGEKYEFAMARKERKTGQSHQDFFTEVKDVTIIEDLYRRDLTINAIAKNILTDEIIDPFSGIRHIGYKLAFPVSLAFSEDPLRVIRAARFIARFDLQPTDQLIKLCKELKPEGISSERVGIELMKTMKTASKPSLFFQFLREVGWLNPWFKELADVWDVPQSPKHHPEGSVGIHLMHCIDAVPQDDWFMRTVMLCHDLGKATNTTIDTGKFKINYNNLLKHNTEAKEGELLMSISPTSKIGSAGHEEAGVELTRNMLQKIHFTDHATIRKIGCLVELHMTRSVISEKNYDKICRRTLRRLMHYGLTWMDLVKVTRFDLCGREPKPCPELHEVMADMYTSHVTQLKNKGEMIPIVDGEKLLALGVKEGQEMGRIIKHALELQDRGTLKKDNWIKVLKGAGYYSLQNINTNVKDK